jgi:hypothetical protein
MSYDARHTRKGTTARNALRTEPPSLYVLSTLMHRGATAKKETTSNKVKMQDSFLPVVRNPQLTDFLFHFAAH